MSEIDRQKLIALERDRQIPDEGDNKTVIVEDLHLSLGEAGLIWQKSLESGRETSLESERPGSLSRRFLVESSVNANEGDVRELLLPSQRKPLREYLRFEHQPWVEISEQAVKILARFTIDEELLSYVSFYVRWGSYNDLSDNWVETNVKPLEIIKEGPGRYLICKSIRVDRRGWYGAVFFAKAAGTGETLWSGNGYKDDAKFRVEMDNRHLMERTVVARSDDRSYARQLLAEHLESPHDLEKAVKELRWNRCRSEMPVLLYEVTKEDARLRDLIARHYDRITYGGRRKGFGRRREIANMLENIGIGEVVLVAPEGPQAMAGGMAQVIIGLLKTLSKAGVPVTLISPLYEFENGKKHASADKLIRGGIPFGNRRLKVRRAGEIDVSFGPVPASRGRQWIQHPQQHETTVYEAKAGNMRLLLLRSARYACRIYPTAEADEQLKRSLFLSRGAIEVMKNPLFAVNPRIVISNDWITGLVPILLQTDWRYNGHPNLKGVRTIHMVHNGGRDYHGRIPVHFKGMDLWSLLEIDSHHYAPLTDPTDYQSLNMTAGAIYHLNGALLVVSKPYAEQLLGWNGAEGLNGRLWDKRDCIYGISNGVDQGELRSRYAEIGRKALAKMEPDTPIPQSGGLRTFVSNLSLYRRAAKKMLQSKVGLDVGENRVILSMVGRMAEQKGLDLLYGWPQGEGVSVLESILLRYPETQIVIAGPTTQGDKVSEHFRNCMGFLAWKYPGRVAALLDFVSHDKALEIFFGSDFSLMPSRFEPGGLTQLESLCCGTPVIARNIGGLSATLVSIDWDADLGNSFLFNDYNPTVLRDTICHAIVECRNPDFRTKLMLQAAFSRHDWSHRLPRYLALFQQVLGVMDPGSTYSHLAKRQALVDSLRPRVG